MNAYKQNEQERRDFDGGGWRPQGAAHPVTEPIPRRSLLGQATTALHTSRRVRVLAALGLVVVCGLATVVLALSLTPKSAQALEAVVDLPPGTVITSADLKPVAASGPASAMIPKADQASILGQTVRVEVPAGALLNEADLGPFPPVGSTVVPVAVKPGQYPTDLESGDTVAVFPISNGTSASTATAARAAATGTVTQISPVAQDGTGEVVIDLEVTTTQAAVVAQAPSVVLVGLDARGDLP
jgi:hypothetical protein